MNNKSQGHIFLNAQLSPRILSTFRLLFLIAFLLGIIQPNDASAATTIYLSITNQSGEHASSDIGAELIYNAMSEFHFTGTWDLNNGDGTNLTDTTDLTTQELAALDSKSFYFNLDNCMCVPVNVLLSQDPNDPTKFAAALTVCPCVAPPGIGKVSVLGYVIGAVRKAPDRGIVERVLTQRGQHRDPAPDSYRQIDDHLSSRGTRLVMHSLARIAGTFVEDGKIALKVLDRNVKQNALLNQRATPPAAWNEMWTIRAND